MYRKILVAYDGSHHSETALRQASELARLSGAELHILGIVVMSGAVAIAQAAGPSMADYSERERKQMGKALEAVAKDLAEQGLQVDSVIREGDPSNEIVAYAHELGADLAVIGHSDKGLLTRWLMGSTGARLFSQLPCSLLIAT